MGDHPSPCETRTQMEGGKSKKAVKRKLSAPTALPDKRVVKGSDRVVPGLDSMYSYTDQVFVGGNF